VSLPVVRLSGTVEEQGFLHGRELKDRVAHNIAVYFHRFEHEGRLDRREVLARAARFVEALAAQDPDYLAGVRGIAEGSGCDFLELAAVNARYEILYHQFTANALANECTAFALLPTASANGHLIIGQNWDWIPEVQGAVLQTKHADGLETLSFTEAGIFGGKIGLNSMGLGLAVNGMTTTDDDWSRLRKPFHARCYEILRSRSFQAAVEAVTGTDRSCSTNYLIAQSPDRVVDIEAAPGAFRLLPCDDRWLVHTNHFLDPGSIGVTEPPNPRRHHSHSRLSRLRRLLASRSAVTAEDLKRFLSDHEGHPNSVCRHPDPGLPPQQRAITVTSAIMDLHARTMDLTDRQPCLGDWQRVSLG
jgi:isopenicillin-N N-acyltransferase-like protein